MSRPVLTPDSAQWLKAFIGARHSVLATLPTEIVDRYFYPLSHCLREGVARPAANDR